MGDKKVTLKLEKVSKSFAKIETDEVTHALNEIDLTLNSGEFISLVGPSGCGKSTILRLVAGLIVPTKGTVSVDGKEVKMEVKVGDKVIYSKYAGTDVKLDGEEYVIVRQSDILAIVE